MNTLTHIQTLETQVAALLEKRATNTAAIHAARIHSEQARDVALELETEKARQDFRAALLEVESLEMLDKEIGRRAAFTSDQLNAAQRARDAEIARATLSTRADAYNHRRAQAFERRAHIALAFEQVPALWDELHALQIEAAQLADAAKVLNDERAGDFKGDTNVLLWQSRDAIAGNFPAFVAPVAALFDAIASDRNQTERDAVLEMQRQQSAAPTRDEKTEQERADEAKALESYWQGERTRAAVFAFQNWQRAQKGTQIEADNARAAMRIPTRDDARVSGAAS